MFATLLPEHYRRVLTGTFFGILFALGLILVPDYGVSFDEGVQRVSGQISLLYVFQQLPISLQQRLLSPTAADLIKQKGGARQLKDYRDRDYGVVFELPVSAAEQVLRLRDERTIYLFRHYCNWAICFVGFAAFYHLAARRFASWRAGLLGTLLLVLSPRLFPDFFYNDKDAVFLALFTLALATAILFLQRPTWKTAVWHALACALAIDVRIMGVLVPAATLALFTLRAFRGEYGRQAVLVPINLYLGLLGTLVVTMWPYLWEAPLDNFVQAFHNMSHFRWPGSVLYQGKLLLATQLPWHYALVWIGITTPLLYLAAFILGTTLIFRRVLARRWQLYATDAEWQDLLFLGLGLAPILAVIILHSVLYNGWRQLYFCYPMLLLVALQGLVAAWHWIPAGSTLRRYWRVGLGTVVSGTLLTIAGRMIQLHPFENIYFNALATAPAEEYYDADYWGLSFREGLEWVVRNDTRPHIRLYTSAIQPATLNTYMLTPAERMRIELVDNIENADYSLHYSSQRSVQDTNLVYTVKAGNHRLLAIFRLR